MKILRVLVWIGLSALAGVAITAAGIGLVASLLWYFTHGYASFHGWYATFMSDKAPDKDKPSSAELCALLSVVLTTGAVIAGAIFSHDTSEMIARNIRNAWVSRIESNRKAKGNAEMTPAERTWK